MVNHIHNTDDGEQAMGEELRFVQINRYGACTEVREISNNRGYETKSNVVNMTLKKKGKKTYLSTQIMRK